MLDGRIILVTGSARGLGRLTALACAAGGATVIAADIEEDGGSETVAQIESEGGSARFVGLDLADPASIAALAKDIADREGRLHGLVNNGAIATGIGGKRFDEIDIETWDRVMDVNIRSVWLMVRACAPLLIQSGSGRVVNLASDTALWGAPNLLSYVASKGAVMAMTRSLARELGPDGIGITAVAPGILTTESTEYVPAERHAHYADNSAVPGPQAPEDVVGTIAFLLGEAALTLSGQVLPTNRGFVFS
ncbi:MAG: SDR family oxidoreductase [Alphaproteobacteria bacterium]|nr:SDR family oxidoreductase [Alphaproteobacteria bacterium]